MQPLSTRAGGTCSAAGPDVCNIPSNAGPIPTPFPNTANCADAVAGTASQRVKVRNKAVLVEGTQLAFSSGDEAGTLLGVVSGTVASAAVVKSGCESVVVEGRRAATLGSATSHNGPNANQPCGQQVTPSQASVFVNG